MSETDPKLSFTARLLQRVVKGTVEMHRDNLDKWNDAVLGTPSSPVKLPAGQGHNELLADALAYYTPLLAQFDRLSERLDDDGSRDLLAGLIAYRLMGRRAIRLPMNTPAFHAAVDTVTGRAVETDITTQYRRGGANIGEIVLQEIDMRPDGLDLTLLTRPAAAVVQGQRRGYRCADLGVVVRPGDVVLDCGACWGEFSLMAALEAGPEGQVFAFDFAPANLSILRAALERNPHLAGRVEVVARAVWDDSDRIVTYHSNGPGSRLAPAAVEDGHMAVDTLTVDDFAEEAGLARLDFLKMNIEGAEPRALRGAEATIRRFKPKLAVAIAHQPHHILELPRLLGEWVPEYRFRLGHNSMSQGDTILFAAV